VDLQLPGKQALVSGSTAGIGLAIASALARANAMVIVNGRQAKRVAEAVAKIRKGCRDAQVREFIGDL
jgi:NAD(P)-dependent dehydrogenase (short-subunit alcohol dehydrogenase family)